MSVAYYLKCWTGVFFLSTLTVGSWWSWLVVMAASSLLPVMKVLCDGLTLCEWSHEVVTTLIVILSSKYCCRENSLQSHRYWDVWNDVGTFWFRQARSALWLNAYWGRLWALEHFYSTIGSRCFVSWRWWTVTFSVLMGGRWRMGWLPGVISPKKTSVIFRKPLGGCLVLFLLKEGKQYCGHPMLILE